jgi:hypothetical protein
VCVCVCVWMYALVEGLKLENTTYSIRTVQIDAQDSFTAAVFTFTFDQGFLRPLLSPFPLSALFLPCILITFFACRGTIIFIFLFYSHHTHTQLSFFMMSSMELRTINLNSIKLMQHLIILGQCAFRHWIVLIFQIYLLIYMVSSKD